MVLPPHTVYAASTESEQHVANIISSIYKIRDDCCAVFSKKDPRDYFILIPICIQIFVLLTLIFGKGTEPEVLTIGICLLLLGGFCGMFLCSDNIKEYENQRYTFYKVYSSVGKSFIKRILYFADACFVKMSYVSLVSFCIVSITVIAANNITKYAIALYITIQLIHNILVLLLDIFMNKNKDFVIPIIMKFESAIEKVEETAAH